MPPRIHYTVTGEVVRRRNRSGRKPVDKSLKSQKATISLPPHYKKLASEWKKKYGVSFSEWVQDKITDKVCSEIG